jgi:hypothetical protein
VVLEEDVLKPVRDVPKNRFELSPVILGPFPMRLNIVSSGRTARWYWAVFGLRVR